MWGFTHQLVLGQHSFPIATISYLLGFLLTFNPPHFWSTPKMGWITHSYSCGCCKKLPKTEWLTTTQIYPRILWASSLTGSRSRWQQAAFPPGGENSVLVFSGFQRLLTFLGSWLPLSTIKASSGQVSPHITLTLTVLPPSTFGDPWDDLGSTR